jgi:hypothetical protein
MWDVSTSAFNLDRLLGQEVMITGISRRRSKPERHEEQQREPLERAGKREQIHDLQVRSLQLISDTCGTR